MRKYKFISILVTVTFLWQGPLWADVLRPRAAAEDDRLRRAEDMPVLSTPEGMELARILRGILDGLQFDVINRELRAEEGGDYDIYPFPLPSSAVGIDEIRNLLDRVWAVSREGPNRLSALRWYIGYEFFVLGTPINGNQLDMLFQEGRIYKDRFFNSGLFTHTSDGKIRMNGLSLVSKKLRNNRVMYLFADTAAFAPNRLQEERVYIGPDSYSLMDRVYDAPPITGYCVDMGSGSGIQLIASLLRCPGIERAIGVEIDARARHVSKFNAALNGVDDKFVAVSDEAALREALGGHLISFAMADPPFISLPELIDIDPEDEAALSGLVNVVKGINGRPRISLKELYSKVGWGGEDGLRITRMFLDALLPLMVTQGQIVIFSEFAGDQRGPTKIMEYMRGKGGCDIAFEPLEPRSVFTKRGISSTRPVKTYQETAAMAVPALLKQHPEFDPRSRAIVPVFLKVVPRLEAVYRGQGITHFHDGFLVIVTHGAAEPEPVPRRAISDITSSILRPRAAAEKNHLSKIDAMVDELDRILAQGIRVLSDKMRETDISFYAASLDVIAKGVRPYAKAIKRGDREIPTVPEVIIGGKAKALIEQIRELKIRISTLKISSEGLSFQLYDATKIFLRALKDVFESHFADTEKYGAPQAFEKYEEVLTQTEGDLRRIEAQVRTHEGYARYRASYSGDRTMQGVSNSQI